MSGNCGAWESERQGLSKRDMGVNGMVGKVSQLNVRCGERVGMSDVRKYNTQLKRNECGAAEMHKGWGLVLPTEKWTVPSPHRAHGWERWKTSAESRGALYLGAGRLGMSEPTRGNSEARGPVLADSECAGALLRGLCMLKRALVDVGGQGMFVWAPRSQESECEGWKNQ